MIPEIGNFALILALLLATIPGTLPSMALPKVFHLGWHWRSHRCRAICFCVDCFSYVGIHFVASDFSYKCREEF